MSVDAGPVYAQIKNKLEKLPLDIAKYNLELNKITKTANDVSKRSGKAFETMSKKRYLTVLQGGTP
ncbi:MAG: hypothetical protein FWG89_02955 [Treponema sp.]|nr:hypothetical protein [Treponema sp.]